MMMINNGQVTARLTSIGDTASCAVFIIESFNGLVGTASTTWVGTSVGVAVAIDTQLEASTPTNKTTANKMNLLRAVRDN